MSFLHPAAFAGLASLLVLILLSLWRQRPSRVVVPSVRLWERIPDRLPPVRSLRRPRASLSLFLQMLVATALVIALAGPVIIRRKPAPRRIAVVLDGSAYMVPRVDDISRELAKLDPTDDILFIESPSLVRRQGLKPFLVSSDQVGDPGPALDLAASESKTVVFITDRTPRWSPPAGVTLHLVLVGGPLKNTGIVDAGVEEGRLFLRLTESAEVEVKIDGLARRLPAATFHMTEIPGKATRIEASLAPDGFPADDRVVLERTEGPVEVGFAGRPDAAILAAIEANPRARVVRGGSPRLLIRIGSAASRGTPAFVVDVDPLDGVESWSAPGELSVAPHPLMKSVKAKDLKFLEVGKLSGTLETILIHSGGGAPVAGIRRGGEIVLAVRYASTGWPAFPSFPIFWSNVLDYSALGAGAWRVTGLLDEAASRPGLERKPFDPGALGARPLAAVRTDLAGGAIALAALLLALLWFVESRPAVAE